MRSRGVNLVFDACTRPAPLATSGKEAANGAAAATPKRFRLDRFMMCLSSLSAPSATTLRAKGLNVGSVLRYQHIVASGLNVPQSHHGVIFMHHVVAVNGVAAKPIAEAEEQEHALVGVQLGYVLSRVLGCQRVRHPVAGENLMLFQVNVDGVSPIACEVREEPILHAILLNRETESRTIRVHELSIH